MSSVFSHTVYYGFQVILSVNTNFFPNVINSLVIQCVFYEVGSESLNLVRFHPFLQAMKALRENRGIAVLCF
jgi:hypothetical protein